MQSDNLPDILTVPWVLVVEPEQAPISPAVHTPAQPLEPVLTADPDDAPNSRLFYAALAASAIWFILVAGMVLTGAMFPIVGNVLAYLVLMVGLFCVPLTALTCPRPDDDDELVTLGWHTVGPCTPSRNTLTGRQP